MQEKPKVTVSRGRRASTSAKEFAFTQADVSSANGLASFRAAAWDVFSKQTLPDTALEAWRRTDLHLLPASDFKIPKAGAFEDLPIVPEELLRPLTGELAIFRLDDPTDQFFKQVSVILFGGAEVGEDHTFFGESFIQVNFRAAGEQSDLSAVLFASQWLEQTLRHDRQIFKRAFFRNFEIRRRQ